MSSASAIAPHASFQGTTQIRVSETVKRVNAKAVDLLSRQAEINRRIRYLRQVMRGLQDLTTRPSFNRGTMAVQSPRVTQGARVHSADGLTRACRIALMEVAGAASLEEIRARIIRRGSFSFTDLELASAAMVRTLNAMTDGGEVCCMEGTERRWQRFAPAERVDVSQAAMQLQSARPSSNAENA
jgi:hypothetical protein